MRKFPLFIAGINAVGAVLMLEDIVGGKGDAIDAILLIANLVCMAWMIDSARK